MRLIHAAATNGLAAQPSAVRFAGNLGPFWEISTVGDSVQVPSHQRLAIVEPRVVMAVVESTTTKVTSLKTTAIKACQAAVRHVGVQPVTQDLRLAVQLESPDASQPSIR